nr:MAG TPA: hypothetical protein [Caudoviricetes sp.]
MKHQRKQKKPLQVRNYSYHKSHVLNLPTPGRQSPHYQKR